MYAKKEILNKNFFNDRKKLLGRNHVIQDFNKCDFRPIYAWHLAETERKKERNELGGKNYNNDFIFTNCVIKLNHATILHSVSIFESEK